MKFSQSPTQKSVVEEIFSMLFKLENREFNMYHILSSLYHSNEAGHSVNWLVCQRLLARVGQELPIKLELGINIHIMGWAVMLQRNLQIK
jgi:hypothetical protein